MKRIILSDFALDQMRLWAKHDPKILKKILDLIADIRRDPFTGIGKPEPLKHQLKGCWSRRITDEHRIVYQIENDLIIIHSCKSHYD